MFPPLPPHVSPYKLARAFSVEGPRPDGIAACQSCFDKQSQDPDEKLKPVSLGFAGNFPPSPFFPQLVSEAQLQNHNIRPGSTSGCTAAATNCAPQTTPPHRLYQNTSMPLTSVHSRTKCMLMAPSYAEAALLPSFSSLLSRLPPLLPRVDQKPRACPLAVILAFAILPPAPPDCKSVQDDREIVHR